MVYQIYDLNDYKILAPLKCGSRYLEKYLGKPTTIESNVFKSKLIVEGVKKIVIRSPMEHLISALHTAILGEIEDNYKTGKDIPHEKVFMKYLLQFKGWDTNSSNAHWSKSTYEEIYFYWRRNREYVDILHLSELTYFLKDEGINVLRHNPKDYNFNQYKYWCSKEDLMFFLMDNYKSEWKYLQLQIDESNVWYNHLMNKEVIEIDMKMKVL